MFVCCVLSGRGLRHELIICPEESYRLWCFVECDLETSRMRRSWTPGVCRAKWKKVWHMSSSLPMTPCARSSIDR